MPTRPEFGSDLVVDLLRAAQIEYVAFNPGATFRGVHDSLVNYGGNSRPEIILCCHEEIAVSLAHGYAKAKGKLMAAITHNVVGLQHASMAIFNAFCDRAPILVLGGTGPMDTTKRRPWIDWIHTALVQGSLVRDYVKWDDQPASVAAIPEAFVRAWRMALTEPQGPVYLCLDAALQEEGLERAIPLPDLTRFPPPTSPQGDPRALEDAARRACEAESPLILAESLGRRPGTGAALQRLADLLVAPVVDLGDGHRGRASFPNRHLLDLSGAKQELVQEADLILALDVQDLLGALGEVDRSTRQRAERPIAQSALAAQVWEAIKTEDWILTNGTANGWVRKLWDWVPERTLGGSGGAGLGYGLGASLGVALAHRGSGKLCVDLQSDGDLLYVTSGLFTAAHHRLPLLIVTCNNRSYYNDEEHQERMAIRRGRAVENKGIGIRIEDPAPDFATIARGFGVHAEGPIDDPAALQPALKRALRVVKEDGLPALLDVVIQAR